MTKILAIESSCDDTAAAIMDNNHQVLAEIVINQQKEHQPFRGVVPEIAARSHLANLELAITSVLKESKLSLTDMDAIAATGGPGLIGGVITGTMTAKALASSLKKPFIAINHLEGHALTACWTNNVTFPYLLLLVSGGHSQFIAVRDFSDYKLLGRTLDDSAGEAFDKVAKMLGLAFPGGPEIEKLAKSGHIKYPMPKPMIYNKGCDLSFSGLKTAVRLLIESFTKLEKQDIMDIAASFQHTVSQILENRVINAINSYEQFLSQQSDYCEHIADYAKKFVIAGGVASNQYLRHNLERQVSSKGYKFFAPPARFCTDNAAMIAFAALCRFERNLFDALDFCPRAKWGIEELN